MTSTLYTSNIGRIATANGYSLPALARKAGVSETTVRRYWQGSWPCSSLHIRISTLIKLGSVLAVPIDDLISSAPRAS